MRAPMDKLAIIQALRELVGQKEIHETPLLPPPAYMAYEPIAKYLRDLRKSSKPESAAEDLFRSLLKDVLGYNSQPQFRAGSGFVDFAVQDQEHARPLLFELKPLFSDYDPTTLVSHKLKPDDHLDQITNYLRDHEYVVLTDLRDAYCYNARETYVEHAPFDCISFPDLLDRALQMQSLLEVIRRVEDEVEKPELDRVFFEDLKEWYNRFSKLKFSDGRDAEWIILLINKLIFAKTLEDFGLVPYRFIQDEYESQKERWQAKGAFSILRAFFRNFEEFFDDHYDTELFETRFWEQLDKSPDNLDRCLRALDDVLGIDAWSKVFQRGIVHYNYRRINEDIFGKSYEMFLAANRKDEGIYYTPAPITTPMANQLVAALVTPLVDKICVALAPGRRDFAAAEKLLLRLYDIRIVDMAGGSGGFLIKVLRAIWEQYQRIAAICAPEKKFTGEFIEATPEEMQLANFRKQARMRPEQCRDLVSAVLLRHIWCVDKDPGALEVAKANIWKEAVKLAPGDYNFRKLEATAAKILPNLELNCLCGDSLVDVEIERQVAWLAQNKRDDLAKLHVLRNQYIAKPGDHAPLDEARTLRGELRTALDAAFKDEHLPEAPLLAALHFFPCYFAADGAPLPPDQQGFDGNIGNPPWGNVKPVRKEFARVGKYSVPAADMDAWFEKKLKNDAGFKARWEQYEGKFETYKEFLGCRFRHQGSGDWNLFKLFLENNLTLLRKGGRLVILVPSGIQTDEGCAALRKLLTAEHTLLELTSFENKGYKAKVNGGEKHVKIFPDVHPQYKFGYLSIVQGEPPPDDHAFDARFYLHDPADAAGPAIRYGVAMARRFSPDNLSFMEFRTQRDYELCAKLRANHPLLGSLGYQFRRELHMSEDSGFFKKATSSALKSGQLWLFEGKMIFQFDTRYAPGNYFVIETEVREELLRKEIFRLAQQVREAGCKKIEDEPIPKSKEDFEELLRAIFREKKFSLDYECERVAYRSVGRSTDERTLITSVIPENVCMAHSLYYLIPNAYIINSKGRIRQEQMERADKLVLVALFNSLPANYYMRNKVSANLNISFVDELPIPKLGEKLRGRLMAAAEKLLASPHDVKERAKLEVLVAREVYGLDAEDWQHLTGTFTFGGGASKAELDEIIARSREAF